MADDLISAGAGQEEEGGGASWETAFNEASQGTLTDGGGDAGIYSPSARSGKNGSGVDLDFLLDISLNVTAEIGRAKMPINELLQLNQGSIISLDKQVGESIDVLVNGRLMARGEVVMVNEMFAIRLTEIIGPKERIQQLS